MEQLPQFDAVRLFVERAGRAAPEFTLDESNAVSVASICQRLDGIPLAIELAAARVRVMPAPQIAARLDNIFRLLTGGSRNVQPRQQTLKATMDWSYALLSLVEKLTLQRLSTFAGSCTLEAAESVLPGEEIETPEVLDLLTSLMDKSLILTVATSGGSIRYRMLETVRQYAHDHLLESGGGEAARDRHLAYYLQLSEQADACLRGKDQLAWLERLEEELDNLRLALDWSLVGHLEEGLRLASGLMWFWHIHTHHNEAVQRLGDLLAAEAGNRGSQPLAVGVQSVSYLLAWIRVVHAVVFLDNFHPPSFTLEQKMAMISSSIALCRELGQAASRELAWGLIVIGVYTPQDSEQSILYLQESLAISRRELYPYYEAHCFYFLSDFSFMKGDIQQAIQYKEQGLAFFRKIGDVDGIASCLVDLAKVVFYQGDQARARALVEEGLAYYKKAGNLQASNGFCALLLRIMPDPDTIQRAEEALAFCRETQDIVQGNILLTLSEVLWSQGDFPRAEGYGQDVIAYVQEVGGERFRTSMMACLWLGRLALTQNNLLKAGQYFKTAVLCMRKRASSFAGLQVFVYILDALAVWSAAGGNMERAARALGALEELYQRFVPDMLPRMCSEHDAALATVRQTLGEQAFDQAWNEGKALTLEQALEAVRQAEGWEEED
jgi:tetratricopeptide (TPR) repeat protein